MALDLDSLPPKTRANVERGFILDDFRAFAEQQQMIGIHIRNIMWQKHCMECGFCEGHSPDCNIRFKPDYLLFGEEPGIVYPNHGRLTNE